MTSINGKLEDGTRLSGFPWMSSSRVLRGAAVLAGFARIAPLRALTGPTDPRFGIDTAQTSYARRDVFVKPLNRNARARERLSVTRLQSYGAGRRAA